MKNLILTLVAVLLISLTANAQKDTTTYKNGWAYGRSVENAIGRYYAPDSTGVKFKTVLTIMPDSVKFNNETYYVEASQDRGEDSPIRLKDCYYFVIYNKNGDAFDLYVEKVKNRNASNKYHIVVKENDVPIITGIAVKAIDYVNLREAREKQHWFSKMYANK